MSEAEKIEAMTQYLVDCIDSVQPIYVGNLDHKSYKVSPDGTTPIQNTVKKEDFAKTCDFMACVNLNNEIIQLFCEWYFEKYNESIVGKIALPKFRKIYETEFLDWLYDGF